MVRSLATLAALLLLLAACGGPDPLIPGCGFRAGGPIPGGTVDLMIADTLRVTAAPAVTNGFCFDSGEPRVEWSSSNPAVVRIVPRGEDAVTVFALAPGVSTLVLSYSFGASPGVDRAAMTVRVTSISPR